MEKVVVGLVGVLLGVLLNEYFRRNTQKRSLKNAWKFTSAFQKKSVQPRHSFQI